MQQKINYFVSGHTAKGYVNYLHSNLKDVSKVIILQRGDYRSVAKILFQIIHKHEGKTSVEEIYDPQGAAAIGGVIFRDEKLAVLSESIVDKPIKGAIFIDLSPYYSKYLIELDTEKMNQLYKKSYAYFKKGLEIHDQLEKVYIKEMNFEEADKIAEDFIGVLLATSKMKKTNSNITERLFGTNTLHGMVNVVEDLLDPIGNRVYVKGRAGTGKSVFMKKVWRACERYGFDIEVYHCSFDPESIDMIIVRELDFCIFDSTDPHEFFPKSHRDKVIDLYETTVTAGTDELYEEEIKGLTASYKKQMSAGIQKLKEIKKYYPNEPADIDMTTVIKMVEQEMLKN